MSEENTSHKPSPNGSNGAADECIVAPGARYGDHVMKTTVVTDPDLAKIVRIWPRLPAGARVGIVAMVDAFYRVWFNMSEKARKEIT